MRARTWQSSAAAGEEPAGDASEAASRVRQAERVLQEFWARWRSANTLEYRSEAIVDHQGELRMVVRIHAYLRRPNQARVVFFCRDRAEASRVRVCDGVRLYDRQMGRVGSAGRTQILSYSGRLAQEIPHPLDEAGYSIDQFLGNTPFLPSRLWGNGGERSLRPTAERIYSPKNAQRSREAYRITFRSGDFRDTLLLDAFSFSPLELRREGVHGGAVQLLLTETFLDVRLNGPRFAPSMFLWTEEDEQGVVRDEILQGPTR